MKRNIRKYQQYHSREKRLGKDTRRRPLYASDGMICQQCNKRLSRDEQYSVRGFPAPYCAKCYDALIVELQDESSEAEQDRRERHSVGNF